MEFLSELGMGRTLARRGAFADAQPHFEAALRAPVRHAELVPSAYLELAKAARETGDEALARVAARAAISADAALPRPTGATESARSLLASVDSAPGTSP